MRSPRGSLPALERKRGRGQVFDIPDATARDLDVVPRKLPILEAPRRHLYAALPSLPWMGTARPGCQASLRERWLQEGCYRRSSHEAFLVMTGCGARTTLDPSGADASAPDAGPPPPPIPCPPDLDREACEARDECLYVGGSCDPELPDRAFCIRKDTCEPGYPFGSMPCETGSDCKTVMVNDCWLSGACLSTCVNPMLCVPTGWPDF